MTDYAKVLEYRRRHHERFVRFVEARKLTCQDCGGGGGEVDVVLPETGQGPWMECGWCEGTGYMTPWERGQWLKYKRQEKQCGSR